jgi:hypothetical protein
MRLPDARDKLKNDWRYAIRLANTGVWDEQNGSNILVGELKIPRQKVLVTP